MSFSRRTASALILLPAVTLVGGTLSAQRTDSLAARVVPAIFRGRVLTSRGTPIADADVWLIVADKHVVTDSSGAFRVGGLPAGKELVQVRHVGFAVARDTVQLSAEHENVRTYALTEQSATLDTVRTVAGQTKYLAPQLRGFEERRAIQARRLLHLRQRIPTQREQHAGRPASEPHSGPQRRQWNDPGLGSQTLPRPSLHRRSRRKDTKQVQRHGNPRLLRHHLPRRHAVLHRENGRPRSTASRYYARLQRVKPHRRGILR